ncbi:poly(A) RNA polymerase, mitochondrial-like [Schistocerca cancellata]|uniref:poly(A) RNA polymerase, mitochondrial-like n=1 Tax=Schistocerca cancellata TaxID=274614 RepID=UPI002118E6DA|nr:poly(A) RNA polymerase, mitochondrial-like [Schistocerca cancellata]
MTLIRMGTSIKICKTLRNFCTTSSRSFARKIVLDTQNDITAGQQMIMTFREKVENRRNEAKRSVIVQVQSEKSATDLYNYCSEYGKIESMHHYCLNEQSHFILVEFKAVSAMERLLNQCCHLNESHIIPTRTPFLWFRSKSPRKKQARTGESDVPILKHQYGTAIPTDKDIKNLLQGAKSLSEQIDVLYSATHLNDVGERLRFLTARQIEIALCGPFPNVEALPFGSSVNGFGRMGCDLDIVLQLDNDDSHEKWEDCRLVFQAKTSSPNGRASTQRLMETVGDMCQLFLPGVTGVKRILQARVPIVKFQQDLTGIECDLSASNAFAVQMSELLYILGSHDVRVRPLVFAVRAWARYVGLTNPVPGRWITNFSLVLMVLYFLQQRSPPILPALDKLSMSSTALNLNNLDARSAIVGSDHEDIPSEQDNRVETVGILFTEFLAFYSSFDFNNLAINLLTSANTIKPEHSPLYIVNPLEPNLNVSKNVGPEEVEKLRMELRNSAWLLESADVTPTSDKSVPWGLLTFFRENHHSKEQRSFAPPVSKRRRVSINKLFLEETR